MQQMMPPPVKSTVKDLVSKSSKGSKRRFVSLVSTAVVASGIGVTLGSTVRFHMGGTGETAPLFKPQQDFPPLAKWPPEIPVDPSYKDFDRFWQEGSEESDVPQLVYKASQSTVDTEDPQGFDELDGVSPELAEFGPGEKLRQIDDPVAAATLQSNNATSADDPDAPFINERGSSHDSAITEDLTDETLIELRVENEQPLPTDIDQLLQKQPTSATPLRDNPSAGSGNELTAGSEELID